MRKRIRLSKFKTIPSDLRQGYRFGNEGNQYDAGPTGEPLAILTRWGGAERWIPVEVWDDIDTLPMYGAAEERDWESVRYHWHRNMDGHVLTA